MPLTPLSPYTLPSSPSALPLPSSPTQKFFLLFLAPEDQATGESWCGDVRAALPVLRRVLGGSGGEGDGDRDVLWE
ncbi:predicted protein [Plenodomus lingam JN3]|uniref:Predicted protein n=1 Tax=Leptosphaeria maculans (strain JN3 / isolate v23.1.3 / race Av1-4-5-6-7-8) TaxID=985895 RepID=E4ZSQ9_LEPMJ|nr:predicted protein [Plenodomus lingam JN3]CBX94439.1 predicted protein [Plenodomus lingam JN3]